jgi:NAD(P)H-hydrate epimerase
MEHSLEITPKENPYIRDSKMCGTCHTINLPNVGWKPGQPLPGLSAEEQAVFNTAALTGSDERVVIVTPHPGEMARLIGRSIEEVQANRVDVAVEFAMSRQVYVVLKGHRTIIATPDGRVCINPTGNPGMATAGTGDVLTGLIAAWLAQLLDAESACRLAVFLHGAAGDLAEVKQGQVSMVATDVLRLLGETLTGLITPESADEE